MNLCQRIRKRQRHRKENRGEIDMTEIETEKRKMGEIDMTEEETQP